MIPNTNLTMPSSTASTVCHQYTAASTAAIGTTIKDFFFKILVVLHRHRIRSCCTQDAEVRSHWFS